MGKKVAKKKNINCTLEGHVWSTRYGLLAGHWYWECKRCGAIKQKENGIGFDRSRGAR